MIKRDLEPEIQRLAKQFPVVAILGPRQSGKTTLARQCFKDYLYVSLENPDSREFALQDPRGFLKTHEHPKGVIFDEVQQAPSLFSYIQTIVDERQSPGQFILTGSQNFQLHAHLSQSLAGRVATLKLLPLSMQELSQASLLPPSYEQVLFDGGYPRIHTQKISPLDWYPNYIQTYVEKDIRQLKNIPDLYLFQRFIKLCAGRIGQVINWSDLGRDAGVSYHTAQSWVSLLETSFILFLLPPYYKNFSKRLVKAPKLYFYDTGLACSLLDISSPSQLDTHFLKGGLFESFILTDLMKERLNAGRTPAFYYWRDKAGHEIDFIMEGEGKTRALEIKSAKTISPDSFSGLLYWQNVAQASPEDCFLIYGGDKEQMRSQAHVLSWDKTRDVFS